MAGLPAPTSTFFLYLHPALAIIVHGGKIKTEKGLPSPAHLKRCWPSAPPPTNSLSSCHLTFVSSNIKGTIDALINLPHTRSAVRPLCTLTSTQL